MENKREGKGKRILGIFFVLLFVLFLCALLVTSFLSKREGKPTFLFGYALLWVKTESMEPTIPARSYILVRAYDGEELAEGMVITYLSRDASSPVYGSLVTHRILSREADGYRTGGDHALAHPDPVLVTAGDIVATYVANLPVLSAVGRVFASPVGLLVILAFFLFTTTFLYIPDIISVLREGKTEERAREEKEKEIQKRIEEEIKKLEEKERGEKR